MRTCPKCSARVVLHKAEALEDEEEVMKALSRRLVEITPDGTDVEMDEAREIIRQLGAMNLRWNIQALDEFIAERQRELGVGMRR
ncbi:MAG: hypothetical protein SVP26_10345 [Chloroflexota bacterium]|nr:hypothetical protein [Chloroflexota bacterium]